MPLEWFDSHCHFDFEAFDPDRSAIWERCRQPGLTRLMIPGTSEKQWARAAEVSAEFPGLYFSAGLHPWWLQERPDTDWEALLAETVEQDRCLAVGECGLDKLIETPMAEQEALLERQLALAKDLKRPVILHCVRAHNELIRLLKRHSLPKGGVVHAFTGSPEIAETYWGMGFYLGIGGSITYERARTTREAVQRLPLEALVLETDAPDMPLSGRQGARNSPEYLPEVADTLARLREEKLEVVAAQTNLNAQRLFRLT